MRVIKKTYNWYELDSEYKGLVIYMYSEDLKLKGFEASEERLSRLFYLLAPNIIFYFEKDIIKSFEFDKKSLNEMGELSNPFSVFSKN